MVVVIGRRKYIQLNHYYLVPSRLEFEIAIANLKKYKSPGSDRIPAELIQAESETLLSAIHKLINSVWKKEELPDQW
jgi:hypothetical protein